METARVAWAASPKGTPAMRVRDLLQELFIDDDFAGWFPVDGRRGVSPARLALVSVLQYAENLTDRQAARAVACRIDWKYALGMELSEPGFDHSVLSEFRDRLAVDDRADRLLAVMVHRLAEAGLVKRRGRARTDSTHVLAAVRRLNRVELVAETMRAALEALAKVDEVWLAAVMPAHWAGRYGRSVRHERQPGGAQAIIAYVEQVGADGAWLLQAVYAGSAPAQAAREPAVDVLRRVWIQQYWYDETGTLRWRDAKMSRARRSRDGTARRNTATNDDDTEPARVPWSTAEIVSPHDPEARFSHKPGKVEWVGYKDHQTETCGGDNPNLIVHVVTTPAPEQDITAVDAIHAALTTNKVAPAEHLVDSGYVTPEVIHRAAVEHDITVVGPVREDPRAGERPGFAKEDFQVNWQDHTVTCPQGATSPAWKPTLADRKPRLSVLFRRADCRTCTARRQCTGNVDGKGRHLLLLPEPLQKIQNTARTQQKTADWKKRYHLRAGAESTVSETVRAHGLRQCRYRGLAKTHVQHVLTAAAANIIRLDQHRPGRNRRPRTPLQQMFQPAAE
ncbi:IS1182 family transposase [Couchioplanes caeruleus]|uniref:Transposase n=1 Tax=Couchioplanes caeruleus TaxID=56438 RepID=A0A3N1GTJ9_9ACTN|nr:IS1182 family transposase [Couchioplanes caeruleus]ROP33591.1 transposase [Couchioplanes caeruleus]ROP33592.1 transposase [Couchioplanes caeruleus]